MKMTTALFIIDPQKDFIDDPKFMGSLAVTGANEDMRRLADHINETPPDAIVVTLDTHEKMHIANPMWWVDENGKNPEVFTLISVEDVISKKWMAHVKEKQESSLAYVMELEKNKKFKLCIWPYHCIDGTEGHKVTEVISIALNRWEISTGKKVQYVMKGQNPNTEHYSGLKAEVVISSDPKTKLNTKVINFLNSFDSVEVAGEAKSHCVSSTTGDLIGGFGANANKIVILENCMSSVSGFENAGETFIEEAKKAGCKVVSVVDKSLAKKMKI